MSSHGHSESHGGGGMPAAAHEEAHEGAPEWLISFADNTALIMGFFVILLALNMGPKGTAAGQPSTQEPSDAPFADEDVAIAIREAFNNPVDVESNDPKEAQLVRRLRELRGDENARDDGPLGKHRRVQSLRRGDYYSVVGSVPFDRGSTALNEHARAAVAEVVKHVRGVQLVVEVRGHVSAAEAVKTDDRGTRLSFERAMAVCEELINQGADWRQLRVQASGDNERVTGPVYDWEGHADNQRVEIMMLNSSVSDVPPGPDPDNAPESSTSQSRPGPESPSPTSHAPPDHP